MKKYITAEQAIGILPDGDKIHTFYNPGFGLIGADWDRAAIIDKLQKSDHLEFTGPAAKGMGHGLCAYNDSAKYQSEILFIETDMDRLEQLETGLDGGMSNGKAD